MLVSDLFLRVHTTPHMPDWFALRPSLLSVYSPTKSRPLIMLASILCSWPTFVTKKKKQQQQTTTTKTKTGKSTCAERDSLANVIWLERKIVQNNKTLLSLTRTWNSWPYFGLIQLLLAAARNHIIVLNRTPPFTGSCPGKNWSSLRRPLLSLLRGKWLIYSATWKPYSLSYISQYVHFSIAC